MNIIIPGLIGVLGILTASAAILPYKDSTLAIEQRVDDLLGRMTLDEKIAQLQHLHSNQFLDNGKLNMGKIRELTGGRSFGCIEAITLPSKDCSETMQAIQRHMVENTRLGIPVFTVTESLHGSVHDDSTIFPQTIALGSTFNPELANKMTASVSAELKEQGIWQSLSPGMDLVRDLRWGRVEECFGEDTLLVTQMGLAEVKGYLDNGISPMLKPMGAHGSPSGGLNLASVECGERTMLQVYLKPYETIIKTLKPWAVMSSYNSWNNEPNSSSSYLLTELLRNQWGFRGYVYSDWGAIGMLQYFHKTAVNNSDAALQALTAGLDVEAAGSCYNELKNLVGLGYLDEKYIDEAVRRILRAKFSLGMFERPYQDVSSFGKKLHCPEHVALARKIAEESIVLVKNENKLLPLDAGKIRSIALIGPNADQVQFGDYTWSRANKDGVTLVQAVKEQYGKDMDVLYAKGCELVGSDRSGFESALEAARSSDVSVVVIGSASASLARDYRNATCGEGFDLSDLNLTGVQEDLVKAVQATGKPVVVVLLAGKPFAMPWIKKSIPSILVQWYPGEQGGYALADVLFGKVNPSGKLNFSFPQSVGHLPCYYNHLPTDKGFYKVPGTSDTPGKDYVFSSPDPLWSFGHGLSYSEFEYASVKTDKEDYASEDTIQVTVSVRNKGQQTGKEVVQVYVRDLISSVATPVKELKGFNKVLIPAGESRDVTVSIPVSELAILNLQMKEIVEPGNFELQVGRASDDIRLKKVISVDKKHERRIPMRGDKSVLPTATGPIVDMEVTGIVRDVQSNVLPGIGVTDGETTVLTNQEGRFSIKCRSNARLTAESDKYKSNTVPVNNRKIINITVLLTD